MSAESLKQAGNELFKAEKYKEAIEQYSGAITHLQMPDGSVSQLQMAKQDTRVSCLLNRAACCLKTNDHEQVVADCTSVLAVEELNVKALFRRGQAFAELQKLSSAKSDLLAAAKLAPKDRRIREQYESIKNKTRFTQGFEKMLEEGGQQVEEDQLEDKGLGWMKLEQKVYTYPVAEASMDSKPEAKDFEVKTFLGEGNFCRVHYGTHTPSGEEFAIKIIEKSKVQKLKRRQHKNIENEIFMEKEVMRRLRHPNIGRLYYTFQDKFNLYFAVELLPCGELWHKLMDRGNNAQVGLFASQTCFYAGEIVNALDYLRESGIAHRDLKPENLMVTATGHLKLIDFGTAKNLVDTKLNGGEFVGTPEYMAPEVFHNRGTPVDARCDLWSLGCLIFQLIAGENPFKSGSPYLTFKKARKGLSEVEFPAHFTAVERAIVADLIVVSPDARAGGGPGGFADLKAHAYFSGVDFGALLRAEAGPPPLTAQEEEVAGLVERFKAAERSRVAVLKAAARAEPVCAPVGPAVPVQTLSALSDETRNLLFHHVNRRKLFATTAYRDFALDPSAAPFQRAGARNFVGLSTATDFEYTKDFLFVVISNPRVGRMEGDVDAGERNLHQAVVAINALVQAPKFVVIIGEFASAAPGTVGFVEQTRRFRAVVEPLDVRSPLVFVPDDAAVAAGQQDASLSYGDDYFSFWAAGCIGIVARPGSGDAHTAWLAKRLSFMKTSGARQLLVFHSQPCYRADLAEADTPDVLPAGTRHPFVEAMRLAGVRAAFSAGDVDGVSMVARDRPKEPNGPAEPSAEAQASSEEDAGASVSSSDGDSDPEDVGMLFGRSYPLQIASTAALCGEGGSGGIRIVRAMGNHLDHSYYALDGIPGSVKLDEEHGGNA
jgi:3-phosphoinositide dependent protein kinase-1